MEEMFNKAFMLLAELSETMPYLETTLALIGGFVVIATVLKPVVYWIVSKTETEKDEIIANRFYQFLDSFGIAFEQLVPIFKRKYPTASDFAERIGQNNGDKADG